VIAPDATPSQKPDCVGQNARKLAELLGRGPFAVLSGAGCSTESGIPDYRGDGTRRRARSPMQHQSFVTDAEARRRYWARSVLGWRHFSRARPNPAHHALAELERVGALSGLITQNVDRLHHHAGQRQVIELHGALADVRCLHCGQLEARDELQHRLLALNPGWTERNAELAPDGDAELSAEVVRDFRVAACASCEGPLKPDVVFFGGSVPKPRVAAAWEYLERARALLVVGSSLAVYSGFRFVRGAAQRGIPIAIVNLGTSRGDELATLRVDARAGEVLPELAAVLGAVTT
jgi:NAD+-dependent protein deacetylase sirtuin 4